MHEIPIEDTIDLHTFQPREVRAVVEEYLYQAVRKGFTEVRIIHGRGIGVQREIVRAVLEKHPDVADFHDLGDRGSTMARLRLRQDSEGELGD
jgi:DNA-nicking Smr family endonuclease